MTTQQHGSRPDRPDHSQQPTPTEPGASGDRVKRAGGVLLGVALLLSGLRRRSAGGAVMTLAGVFVLARTLWGESGGEQIDSSRLLSRATGGEETASLTVSRSVTVGASADELHEAWRDPEVFSRIMGRFAEITVIDDDRYQWTVEGPAGVDLSWDSRIVEDEPGESIRWESPADASVPNSGSVQFTPAAGDRGTVVTLSLDFEPPGGRVGASVVEQLDIVPETLAGHALSRFKSLVESGEIPSLAGNPSGRGEGDLL